MWDTSVLDAGCPYMTAWFTGINIPVRKPVKVCVVCADSIGFILALPSDNMALIRSHLAGLFQLLRSWQNHWLELDSPRAQGHALSGSNTLLGVWNSVIPHQLFID